jgi:hypothetical protein
VEVEDEREGTTENDLEGLPVEVGDCVLEDDTRALLLIVKVPLSLDEME